MGKIAIALLLFCSLILPAPAYHGVPRDPESVADWFDNQIYKTEKLTKLHFFIHHEVSGKNPTALEVVRPNKTHGRFDFGVVVMFDDAVTVGPERDSTEIGRIQGSFSSAGLNEVSLMNNFLLFFTGGQYKGSSLSILGKNTPYEPYREMAVVGGSGVFRLARGVATVNKYAYDDKTGDGVPEYHVMVIHHDSSAEASPKTSCSDEL
ncbi:dirigent protein 22-like [Diospyros lotus]|uniref:dirigent protein 22-like n=1 Tax=Diospyros lotus TaxID=55363 RepID=UPI002256EA82|nr:dirigent protein 22-like [Diospyros lotus]